MGLVKTLLLCCIGFILCIKVAGADHQVVLVAAATSPLHDIDSVELRKIFLGFTVERDGLPIKGLRNISDEDLNNIFLQTVVAMSEKSYKRRQLSLALRKGIPRIAEYDNVEDLIKALSNNPYSISYAREDIVVHEPGIKILRVLWEKF
jgi:hypothetical protein